MSSATRAPSRGLSKCAITRSSTLDGGEAVNLLAGSALVAALGMHLVTLVLWLLGTLLPFSGAGLLGRLSLGPLLLQGLARLPLGQRAHASALARAAGRGRLSWAHGVP